MSADSLSRLGERLSGAQSLVDQAKRSEALQFAQKEVLSIKRELGRLEKSVANDVELIDPFNELKEQTEDVVLTLRVKLYFAERDFFNACNHVCDLTYHEQRGDAVNHKYQFLAEIQGTEERIATAQKSAELGKGISSPDRKEEIQRELRTLSETVQAIRASATSSSTQVEVDSPESSPPPSPTKEVPPKAFPEPVKEKTAWEKFRDFFSSIGDFFSRLFTRLFS